MNPEQLQKLTEIILSLKHRVKCPICLDFVENSVELECSHRFCNICLADLRLGTSLCPVCKLQIGKRASIYKDQFADDISTFTNRTCQLIKEKYAYEVEELCSKKTNLRQIIETAPQYIHTFDKTSRISAGAFKEPKNIDSDRLRPNYKQGYVNKKKQAKQTRNQKVLNFESNDTRTKIISWLNDNQEKLDMLTQNSPQFLSDDEVDFQMPSISQVPSTSKQKQTSGTRSQSLGLNENLPAPLLKRYQSLTEGVDYFIEEDNSETLVKQVERKVLQDILEDECLANLDHVAQLGKEKPKTAPSKRKRKSVPAENKTNNISNYSGSSSGWDRIKDVKKTIKRALKEPKKLKINLQDINANVKKSPKNNSKRSPVNSKSKTLTSKPAETNGKLPKSKECAIANDVKIKPNQIFNLSAVENYFEKHMDNVRVSPNKDTSADMEIDIIDTITKTRNGGKQNNKENITNKNRSFDEDIFSLPTQITSHNENSLCIITPIPKDFNDVDEITIRLSDNLKSCISSAANLHSEIGKQLVQCFTNLLTYSDKILQIRSDKVTTEIRTSQVANVSMKTACIQTVNKTSTAAMQTSPVNKLTINKCLQAWPHNLHNVETQTSAPVCIDQEVQTKPRATKRITKGRNVGQSINYKLSPEDNTLEKHTTSKNCTSKISKQKKPKQSGSSKLSEEEKEILSTKSSQRVTSSKEMHISENRSSRTSNRISQGSVLVCSFNSSNKYEKKINRKLNYEESQNRKFKRIRRPASDSDSDGDGKPSKRKFIRDDLSVEFIDTATKSAGNEVKDYLTPESENMDYDKYLLEVMTRDDPPPQKKNPVTTNQKSLTNESSQLKNSNNEPVFKAAKNKSQILGTIQESMGKYSKDIDGGEHIFTANVAFEKNLDKFDQEILEFERTSKAFNTEFDLVENTPIVSPKPKLRRLSNKKKDSIVKPLQIISKGSATGSSFSKKSDSLRAEDHLSNLLDKEPSTLNQNIVNLPTQTEKCSDDVAGILEDLRNNDDFFENNLDCDGEDMNADIPLHQPKTVNDGVGKTDLSDYDKTNVGFDPLEKINVTQENIDEVLENCSDFDEDDEIEKELQKISFTAAQLENKGSDKINVIQNLKLRSGNTPNKENEMDCIIDSSDEEIIENTPQKEKPKLNNRSLLENLNEVVNSLDDDDLDFCLPPPPGFGDEGESTPPPEELREISVNKTENCPPLRGNKSSLTLNRLTDFIVTPEEESQHSLPFKSFVTPSRPVKEKINSPRISQIFGDNSEGVFSPIAKSSIKVTQAKYTPLVSTSRLSMRKPSLMTSTPNQKSILNYVVSSQDSPAMISQKSKPCIMWSRILNKDLNIFTQLECKKLVTTCKVFGPLVTHLVVLVDEKGQIVSHTAKFLQAIAAGIWVVRYEWAEDCGKMNRIVSEEPYEALDTTGVPGPQLARLSRGTKPLFKGFKFYCAPPLKAISKCDLESILQLSGGEIAKDLGALLENDEKVHIIVTESSATEDTDQFETWLEIYRAVTVDVEWLTSCIGQYKLMSFRPFLVSGDESIICDLGYPSTLVESVPYTLTEAL